MPVESNTGASIPWLPFEKANVPCANKLPAVKMLRAANKIDDLVFISNAERCSPCQTTFHPLLGPRYSHKPDIALVSSGEGSLRQEPVIRPSHENIIGFSPSS